jgi:hypothetical protein
LPRSTLLYSQTYHSQPHKCTGLDQLLLAQGPWENEPILIRGISLTHRVHPPTDDAFAMSGSSAVDGDILGHVSGSGTANIMYPGSSGFLVPGRGSECHIDVHAWCKKGLYHESWLTIFYEKPVPTSLEPTPIPQVNDDRLPTISERHPVYRRVPPDYLPPDSLTMPPGLNVFGKLQWWLVLWLLRWREWRIR